MSVKLNIFNDVRTAILTISGSPIKSVGLYNSQILNEAREIPRTYPIVDIEFTTIVWDVTDLKPSSVGNLGNMIKTQRSGTTANNIITLHIQFNKFNTETQSFPEIDPVIQSVYLAVQLLEGDYYSQLVRLSEEQDTNHDDVIDWKIMFGCMLQEVGEENTGKTKIIGGTLSLDINKDLDIDNAVIRTGNGTF